MGRALGTFTALENLDYQHCIVVPVAVVVFIIAFKDEWRGYYSTRGIVGKSL